MISLLLPALLSACGSPSTPEAAPAPEAAIRPEITVPAPPATPRDEAHRDVYFGVEVADPYHALEDSNAPDTQAWVTAQAAHARAALDQLPARAALHARLTELYTFPRRSPPLKAGDRYFWTYNDGTMDQSVLVWGAAPAGSASTLIDPNTLSEDRTVALAEWVPSDDGRYIAYALAEAGSDWRTWRVRDVATGTDLADELRWVKFSGASWLPDGSGFFYARFPAPESADFEAKLAFQSVWFHRVGTAQEADILIHADKDHADWGFDGAVSEDGTRLWLTVTQGTEEKTRVYWHPIAALGLDAAGTTVRAKPTKLFDAFDALYVYLGEQTGRAWFWTTKDAPKGRIVSIDLAGTGELVDVVPEGPDVVQSAAWIGGRLVVRTLHDAASQLFVYEPSGTLVANVALPGLGTVDSVTGRASNPIAAFGFSGFTTAGEIHSLDVTTGATTLIERPKVVFNPDDFVTEQVRYPSKDGTEVPMFLVRRKDLDRTQPQPTLLYGYGGFNIPITPSFSVSNLAWVEAGGVLAIANLRGGGEFGEVWHEAGTKLKKQNVFDDFIAAGEWLVARGWTTPAKLGTHGRSNGGLLVGATLLQRPDLFGAAVPGVGVHDMLKYHSWTIGWAWASDYGTSADDEAMFKALAAYSPVHNAKPGTYPPTLITTADHDDRVVPAHSFKFGAALQAAQQDPSRPILLRIETRAGHGAGTPVSMKVDEEADKLAFLAHYLGLAAR